MSMKTLGIVYRLLLAFACAAAPALELFLLWNLDHYRTALAVLAAQAGSVAAVLAIENEALRRGEKLPGVFGG